MRKRTASGKSTSCWRLSFWLFSIGFRIITALFHMQSVLIGSEYPVMDTLLFYFSQNSYCNLFRGVAECYAFSRFHDNVGLRDLPAIRHIESADAVVVDHDTLIGKAADQRDGECQSEGGDSLQSISSAATSSETSMYSSWVYQA